MLVHYLAFLSLAPVWAADLTRAQYVMGTLCEITAVGKTQKVCNKAISKAFEELNRLDNLWSTYNKDSEISRMNETASRTPHPCSRVTYNLIKKSKKYAADTKGAFDISVQPLIDLKNSSLNPANALTKVGSQYIELNEQDQTIYFSKRGMGINVGAIGKGYGLDLAAAILKKNRIQKARLNFGGQILVFGPRHHKWALELSHPNNPEKTITTIHISNGSIATSAQRQNHILDPRTGQPVDFEGSVSVISPSGIDADALSTALFVMGPEEGLRFAENRPNLCALFFTKEGDDFTLQNSRFCKEFTHKIRS